MQLLMDYYSGKVCATGDDPSGKDVEMPHASTESAGLLHEVIAPRVSLPPLLSELSEKKAEPLDYIGVSFGLTANLLRLVRGWAKVV